MNQNQETVQRSENYSFILLASFVASIAGLLFGFDTGVISGALPFISKTFQITPEQYYIQELIVSAVPAGALIGAVLGGPSSSKLGRRTSIILAAILFAVGTIVTSYALARGMVIVGRLIMGLAVGLSATIVPMYLAEISPPKIRGAIVFLFQLAITIGIMSAFIINYIFAGSGEWRLMFGVGLIPAILLGVGMLFLPESPRWLMMKGKDKKALEVLKQLHAKKEVDREFFDIKESLQHVHGGFKLLFANKKLFLLVILTFGLFVFQQLTGINTIFYYAPTIFNNAGFIGEKGAILASIATGVVNVLSTVVGIWIVDVIGRRKLLFISFIGMVICLAILGAAYNQLLGINIQYISLFAILTFIFFFAIGMGGCPYLIMSEVFPLNVRGAGMATANFANWGFNWLVSSTFLTMVHFVGIDNTFWVYALLTFIGFIFAKFFVPETKDVALETIEANLYAGKPLRAIGQPLKGMQ